uniref:START domain-containing protein 10 n=1 Tax=Caligus rogercresseyi TaxID=217165 RepID=C1BMR3_CALRO|nr:PCTP-like protein [Caligus rogercresseyi]
MDVNEVRIAGEKDFESLRSFLSSDNDWNKAYDKKNMSVWTRNDPQDSAFKMLRVITEFSDVPAATLFDVIQDPEFWSTWDKYMLEYKNIGYLDPCNDIGYYSLSCPSPMKNRDFVIQSSWLASEKEYIIINHSVSHKAYPQKKGFIRGTSYLTGFLITPLGRTGCTVGYVTHSNPKGKVPNWLSNKLSTTLAPKLVKKIHKACLKYDKWKAGHNPEWKPWNQSQQTEGKKIDLKDCIADETEVIEEFEEILDESAFNGSDPDD